MSTGQLLNGISIKNYIKNRVYFPDPHPLLRKPFCDSLQILRIQYSQNVQKRPFFFMGFGNFIYIILFNLEMLLLNLFSLSSKFCPFFPLPYYFTYLYCQKDFNFLLKPNILNMFFQGKHREREVCVHS